MFQQNSLVRRKESLSLLSPAKVNLFFRVLYKRPDGFHEIASLSQAISLFDKIDISLEERDSFFCQDPSIPQDRSNLILKALDQFREKTGWKECVRIDLLKKIPMQAGLGGGSGNAATTLWGLNQLAETKIPEETLASWAAEFSSDAPFFFSSGAAFCEGRGEKFLSLPPLHLKPFFIAKPKEGLSTPLVYSHCVIEEFTARDPLFFLKEAQEGRLESFNDLETPAFSLMPSLIEYKEKLKKNGFEKVVMTGSGTALMCFEKREALEEIHVPKSLSLFSVEGIHRSQGRWYEFPSI